MKKLIPILFFICSDCYSQFKIIIDKTFEPKIKTAVYLIYTTNVSDFVRLTSECSQIIITPDSTPNLLEEQIIRIPLKVVSSSSYNNIASWLVYQSYQLSLRERGSHLSKQMKDSLATKYELEFVKLLKPESKKSIKQLKKDAQIYWDSSPYKGNVHYERDTISVPKVELNTEPKKKTFFSKILKK